MRALYQKEKVESTYNIMNVPTMYFTISWRMPSQNLGEAIWPSLRSYLFPIAAITCAMKSFMFQAARIEVAPNLTITNFLEGMTTTYCSW